MQNYARLVIYENILHIYMHSMIDIYQCKQGKLPFNSVNISPFFLRDQSYIVTFLHINSVQNKHQ